MIVLFIFGTCSFFFVPYIGDGSSGVDSSFVVAVSNDSSNNISKLSDESVKKKFTELYQMPYVLDLGPTKSVNEFYALGYGDCDDKSRAFATFLKDNGGQKVYVIHAKGNNVSYGHAYVVYQKYAYDLTNGSFKVPESEYKKHMEKIGFDYFMAEKY